MQNGPVTFVHVFHIATNTSNAKAYNQFWSFQFATISAWDHNNCFSVWIRMIQFWPAKWFETKWFFIEMIRNVLTKWFLKVIKSSSIQSLRTNLVIFFFHFCFSFFLFHFFSSILLSSIFLVSFCGYVLTYFTHNKQDNLMFVSIEFVHFFQLIQKRLGYCEGGEDGIQLKSDEFE